MYKCISDSTLTDKKYFLYRHIRLDKNEPFYIGIGTKKEGEDFKRIYERAFVIDGRSTYWKNIYHKTNKNIEVNILFEADTKEKIFEKEIEFISEYGRINLGTGTLCNLTDGGDDKERMKSMVGWELVEIAIYDLYGKFVITKPSIHEVKRYLGLKSAGSVHSVLNGKSYSAKGFIFRRTKEFNGNIPLEIEVNKLKNSRSLTMFGKVRILDTKTKEEKVYINFDEYCFEKNKTRKQLLASYWKDLRNKKEPEFIPIWSDIS